MVMISNGVKTKRIDLKGHSALEGLAEDYTVVNLMPITIFEYDDCHSLVFQLDLESPNFLTNHYIQFNCLVKDFRELKDYRDLAIYSVHSINKKASKDFTETILRKCVFDFIYKYRVAWVFNAFPHFLTVFDERGSNFLRKQEKYEHLEELLDEIESRGKKDCSRNGKRRRSGEERDYPNG